MRKTRNIMAQSVFLGVIDEKVRIENQREQCTLTDSKIGGCPLYSGKCRRFLSNPEITCTGCNELTSFIFQIYCPVDQSPNDRVLYLFACLNVACKKNEFFLYRVISSTSNASNNHNKSDDRLFENTWDDDDDVDKVCQSIQHDLSFKDDDEDNSCQVVQYGMESTFNPYYISVFEEPDEVRLTAFEYKMYERFKAQQEIDGGGKEEGYEKSCPTGFRGDATNYKFYKRIQRCPEQVIRYEWSGAALHPTQSYKAKLDRCPSCSGPRIFELQLMPALITTLRRAQVSLGDKLKLDFETILIYTCAANCTRPNVELYREEVVLLKEEDYNI